VRLWDPGDGREVHRLEGHTDRVNAVCALETGGHTLLASASTDRTVRLWDPTSGGQWETIAVRHPATALTAVGSILFVGVSSGEMALELNSESQPR
jgi:WD40 repeat protein